MNAILGIYERLNEALQPLRFREPVAYVYNPLIYARKPFEAYVARYARPHTDALLLGMNPGPWGMSQTGIPFGEVAIVRDWLKIVEPIGKPRPEHPKRRVEGLACARSEVSGARLWGWARERFGTPDRFFARFFVANYCPLAFIEPSGRNFPLDKLPVAQRTLVEHACDDALRGLVSELRPKQVIGVGGFAADRARKALDASTPVAEILHPSPASPAANRGWSRQAEAMLEAAGVRL